MAERVERPLTTDEMIRAATVGARRHGEAIERGYKDKHGFDPEYRTGLGAHVEGACGELWFANWLGVPWDGSVNTFKKADIGRTTQVKTRAKDNYDLIVRPDDDENHAFVLVTGLAPYFKARGWAWGREVRQARFWKDYGKRGAPAWFVPADCLHRMPEVSHA